MYRKEILDAVRHAGMGMAHANVGEGEQAVEFPCPARLAFHLCRLTVRAGDLRMVSAKPPARTGYFSISSSKRLLHSIMEPS